MAKFSNFGGTKVVLVTASYDHTIRLWNVKNAICERTFQHAESSYQINALALRPQEYTYVAAAGHDHVRLYEIHSSTERSTNFSLNRGKNITCVGFDERGRWMYTGDEEKKVRIWDVGNHASKHTCEATESVNAAVLHPNQLEIIFGDHNGHIHIWDVRTDQKQSFRPEPGAAILSLSIDPTGTSLVAATTKGSCHVYSLTNTELQGTFITMPVYKQKFTAHKRYILDVTFSPDSTYMLDVHDGETYMYYTLIEDIGMCTHNVHLTCRLLATSSADGTCRIWNTCDYDLNCELVHPFQLQPKWVWGCGFNASSEYIVTASADNSVRCWNVNTGDVQQTFSGHTQAVTCLAFHDELVNISS